MTHQVTMQEIADRAGVTRQTVSKIINNKQSMVSESTRRKVLEIVNELHYSPNHFAAALKRGRTNMIGVSLSGRQTLYLTNPYLAAVMEGIARVLPAEHFRMVLHLLDASLSRVDQSHDLVSSRVVDGMIYILSGVHYHEFITTTLPYLNTLHSPFIVIHSSAAPLDCPSVGLDCPAAGRLAAAHLRGQGYGTAGYVRLPDNPPHIGELLQGFTEAADQVAEEHVYTTAAPNWDAGARLAEELLRDRSRLPDALFVPEENTAAGMVTRFREAGLSLPADIAVIAFGDNSEPRRYMPLTTIHQPALEKGKKAAEMLTGKIKIGEDTGNGDFYRFEPELVPGVTA